MLKRDRLKALFPTVKFTSRHKYAVISTSSITKSGTQTAADVKATAQKGTDLNIHRVVLYAAKGPRIQLSAQETAVEELVANIRQSGMLRFDNGKAVLKFLNFSCRISEEACEAYLVARLSQEWQAAVSSSQIKEAIKRMRFMPDLQIDLQIAFWNNQQFVNVADGVYDIETQELIYNRSRFIFDYRIDINYLACSKLDDAPVFKHYVETSIGMDQLECLLRILGYCISSLTKGRKAFIFYGVGRTGKSTILNVLEAVVGEGFVSHEPFHAMSSERAKAHYEGKRVNISRETSSKVNKQEEGFKSLISCECTTGSEKFEKQRDFVATLSFIFAGNTDINFAVTDDAILDRLVYIMFTREIPDSEIDLDLEEKLLAEKNVIFSLALDSLKRLIADKYDFKMSAEAEAHLRHRRLLIHSTESFLEERCQIKKNGQVSKVELHAAYEVFCKANALKPEGRNHFYDRVRAFSPQITDGRVPDANGNSVQGFHGLTILGTDCRTNGNS